MKMGQEMRKTNPHIDGEKIQAIISKSGQFFQKKTKINGGILEKHE